MTSPPISKRAVAWLAVAALAGVVLAACSSQEERRDQHLAAAETQLAAGRTNAAMIELRNALKLDPKNAEINFRIANLMRQTGAVADAAFFYGEAARLDPNRLDAVVKQAELMMFDEPDKADALIDGVVKRDPSYADAYIVRSKVALVRVDTDAALAAVLVAIELDPKNGAYYQQLGKVHQARIREARERGTEPGEDLFKAAIAAFDKASAVSGDGLRYLGYWQKARVQASWRGHEDEAAATYRAALADAQKAKDTAVAVSTVVPDTVSFAQLVGRLDLLEEALDDWVKVSPNNWVAWIGLAKLAKEQGGDVDAVLQRMLAAGPEDSQAHRQYAAFLAQNGRRDEAVKHLEEAAARGIDPPELLGAAANFLIAAPDQQPQAEKIVERMEREFSDHPRTALARAQLDLAQGKDREAADALRSLTGRAEVPAAYHLLATAEYALGDRRAALTALNRAIELDQGGTSHLTLRMKARIEMELGECEQGIRTLSSLVRLGDQVAASDRLLQARCLYQFGRKQAGRSILKRMIAQDPPYLPAVVEFAIQEETSEPDEVRSTVERALKHSPGNPRLVTILARMDLRDKKPEMALKRIDAAIAHSGKGSPELLLQRARVLAVTGNTAAAQQDALRAFEAQPDLPGAAALVVGLYRAQGNESEVIGSFEQAQKAGALKPPAVYLLARLHLMNGDEKRAAELLEQVVKAAPNMALPKNDLAYQLAKEGRDLDRALELAQGALRALPEQPQVIDTLGVVYLKRGLNEPALQQFDHALSVVESKETSSQLYYHRGLALRELGRKDEAAKAFQQALALDSGMEDAARALEGLKSGEAAGGNAPASS